MLILPNQRLKTAQKDKDWRINCVNAFIGYSQQFTTEYTRMSENYEMRNSQLPNDFFRSLCKELDVTEEVGQRYLSAYNISAIVIDTLLGEELNRPWNFTIVNDNIDEINQLTKEKEIQYKDYLTEMLKIQIEKHKRQFDLNTQLKLKEINPKDYREFMKQMEEEFKGREERLNHPTNIDAQFKSRETIKELLMKRLMTALSKKNYFSWLKNQAFEDANIAGTEVIEVIRENPYDFPIIKILDPLNTFYHKTPNSPWIHEGDFAGYRERVTIGKILEIYGDRLNEKDLKELSNASATGLYGTEQTFYGPYNASSHYNLERSGMFPSQLTIDSTIIESGIPGQYIPQPRGVNSGLYSKGLFASKRSLWYNNLCEHSVVYWRSQKQLGVLEFVNPNTNLPDRIFVSDDFQLPKDAKKKVVRENVMFESTKVKYVWYDEERGPVLFEWIWVPEIWKGVRINNNIFVDINPVVDGYQSMVNPYKVTLPIHGYVYNNRNSWSISNMDKMKPWLKLYYIMMARLIKSLAKDQGVITVLNALMFDEKMGQETVYLIMNPLKTTQGVNPSILGNFRSAERIDLSNAQSIQYYTQILEFIENKLKLSIGMSPQRLAQTGKDTNVGDNVRDTQHSINMTEKFFLTHDLLWEQIMQYYMECTLYYLNFGSVKPKLREFLSDSEIALLDTETLTLYDDFKYRITSNSKSSKILNMLEANALALLQNQYPLSQLISLLKNEDLAEFESELKALEEQQRAEVQRKQELDAQLQREDIEARKQMEEDRQINALDVAYLKGQLDLQAEEIRGEYMVKSYNLQIDANNNQIPDVLEYNLKSDDLRTKAEQKNKELALREEELRLEQQKHSESKYEKDKDRIHDLTKQRQSDEAKQRLERIKQLSKKPTTK